MSGNLQRRKEELHFRAKGNGTRVNISETEGSCLVLLIILELHAWKVSGFSRIKKEKGKKEWLFGI